MSGDKNLGERMKLPWKQMPLGFTMPGGTAVEYRTGDWRVRTKPVIDHEKCIMCLFCWVFCPDSCILVQDEKMVGFNLDYCKGCGICAQQCPVDCIAMVEENKFADKE